VSPLTWSHAEFVGTVHRYLDCLRRLQIQPGRSRPAAVSSNGRAAISGNGAAPVTPAASDGRRGLPLPDKRPGG
jgi:hypothetical protein